MDSLRKQADRLRSYALSCTFVLEDFALSKKSLEIIRPANLESIRNIFVYYPDEPSYVFHYLW